MPFARLISCHPRRLSCRILTQRVSLSQALHEKELVEKTHVAVSVTACIARDDEIAHLNSGRIRGLERPVELPLSGPDVDAEHVEVDPRPADEQRPPIRAP